MVWRWQQRFAEEGIEGSLRDKTRPPASRRCRRPRCMPSSSAPCANRRATIIGPAAPWPRPWVFRCERSSAWAAHKLHAPYRRCTFKRSNDPTSPPSLMMSSVLTNPSRPQWSPSTRSQIQALDRTQQGSPPEGGTRTLPQSTHGTTTLFAALSVLEGKVIGRCAPRHRHRAVHPLHRNRRAGSVRPARR